MAQIIQLRRDYSSNWTLANPVLAQGELGIEFDNYNVKIGNGLSSWNELPYGLGTASLPAHTHPYAGTGITTASITGIDIAGTLNSNGLSLAIPAWLTTYSSAAGGGDWTAATVSGTDMLVSTGAGTNTIYYPKYITTAADPVHAHTQYLTTAMVSDAGSNFIGTAYTSHTHNYQSTGNYLTTAMLSNMTSVLQYTSNTSNITANAINTSVTSSYQLIANSTASLGTTYTSHTHNYQSTGDYLTTAAISSHTHGSISIASTAGSDFSYSSASNGMSFSIPKWITTYAAGGGEIAFSAGGSSNDLASIVFSNSNGVGFGLNGSTITASYTQSTHEHPYIGSASTSVFAYTSNSSLLQHTSATSAITSNAVNTSVTSQWLTTAALSNHTHSDLYINTSVSGSFQLTSDNSLSLGTGYTTHTHQYQSTGNYLTTAALSDHTHSNLYIALANSTQYATSVLSNTFQTTGAYLTTAMQSANTSVFAYTSNDSLSLGTGYTTHTHLYQSTGNYLTTAANSTHTHGGLTINATNISTSITSASNGLTINLSVAAPGAGGGIAASIGGNSTSGGAGYSNITSGTMLLAGGNNITLSQAGSAITIVGGAGGGGAAIAAAGATITNNTVIFSNSNGVSFGGNGSTITASIPIGTVNFADSNGITWGSSVNGVSTTITGSIAAYGGTSLSTVSTAGSVLLGGINTAGISLSVPAWLTTAAGGAGIAIAGSDTTYTNGTVQFRGTNVTVNTSAGGQYIDLSVAAPGGGAVHTDMEWHNFTGNSTHADPGQNTIWYQPFELRNPVSASSLQIGMTFNGTSTSAATQQFGMTHDFMLLARHSTNTTRYDSIWSTRNELTVWASGTSTGSYASGTVTGSSAGSGLVGSYIYGQRIVSNEIGSELSAGFYMFGYRQSTSSANYSAFLRSYNPVFVAPLPQAKNFIGSQTNISVGHFVGGRYSVTSASLVTSVGLSELRASNDLRIFFKIGATS